MTDVRAVDLSLAYDGKVVVDDLSFDLPAGRITAIVGANACGKSTLLRGLARLLPPHLGAVLLDGQDIARMPTKQVARKLGLLPQAPVAPEGLTVRDLVARGRFPHQSFLRQWSPEDEQQVAWALQVTGTADLRGRALDELSGGQRQRAWIAMALAQDTAVLLLDEPTTYLDLAHQIEVLDLLDELNERDNRTIVLVLHDLNQACRYADHLIAMRDGKVHARGAPEAVVNADLVQAVFRTRVEVIPDPVSGAPLCIPVGRRGRSRVRSAAPPPRPTLAM